MSDATVLPELIRRESRTFLQYVRESYPWAHTGKDEELRARLLGMAEEENMEIMRLGRMLQRRRIAPPYLGAFPTSFTDYNFLAISFLIPKLAGAQRRDIGELERDVSAIADAEMHKEVANYLIMKRNHLREIETLCSPAQAA
jgi:hypothetical protein